jgi:acetyl-CoA carboxylase carboxyltransferase component
MDIAMENRLPLINLVESGGADLPDQAEVFIVGGKWFRNLTRLSKMGIPTVAIVFGSSTAGGAYFPAMCDYAVMVEKQAKVFLGGPPLVKMATGEESTDEELGGAEMHSKVSGLSDYYARDEHEAIRMGRDIVSHLNWRKLGYGPTKDPDPPVHEVDDILGVIPSDLRIPFDMREILARTLDGSRFEEYKAMYGTSILTGWGSIHGFPVGVIANQQGVIFSAEAQKATEFILLSNSSSSTTPPATWWGGTTSSGASSKTGPRWSTRWPTPRSRTSRSWPGSHTGPATTGCPDAPTTPASSSATPTTRWR